MFNRVSIINLPAIGNPPFMEPPRKYLPDVCTMIQANLAPRYVGNALEKKPKGMVMRSHKILEPFWPFSSDMRKSWPFLRDSIYAGSGILCNP